jgi:hypothetical protein
MRRLFQSALVVFVIWVTTPVEGATLCVNPGGTGGCFSSIQAAVDAAANRDVIDIAAGSYVEGVNIVGFSRLTLQGAGAGSTFIEGASFTALDSLGGDIAIQGVTIRDASRGVFVSTGKLTLRDCAVTGHAGAAVEAAKRTRVTIENCLVSDNGGSSGLHAAAIHSRGAVTIVRSEIRDNQSGGVAAEGKIKVVDSTIHGNGLSGVSVNGGTITGSTISGNGVAFPHEGVEIGLDASRGGSVKISNSTISGNNGVGLSVFHRYGAVLDQVTIANNADPSPGALTGGIGSTSKRVVLRRTIVADNLPNDCSTPTSPYAGLVRFSGVNLMETPGGCLTAGTAPITADPVLGPLQDNGGPTATQALLPGSPAIGASTTGCGGVDQRGVARTSPCDLGAYETL